MLDKQLFLVGSGAIQRKMRKAWVAAKMYYDETFKLAHEYVEKRGVKWFILSGYYLLLEPGFTTVPYDTRVEDFDEQKNLEWATVISNELNHFYNSAEVEIVILADYDYRRDLVGCLQDFGFKTRVPLAGMSIERQHEWLKDEIEKIDNYPLICVQCNKPVKSYDKTDLLGLFFHPDCFDKRDEDSNRKIGLKLAKEIGNIDHFELCKIKALLTEPELNDEDEFEDDIDDEEYDFEYYL